jgi:lipopolysaccharide/colanic/teichoic acid biosynthesis glycosyltransferase
MARRLFDVACAVVGLVVLAPLFLVIAVLIKLDSSGPVFYRGLRAGQYGCPFRIIKFRTMDLDAENRGPAVTTAHDPRITRVGRVLRRTKLDELPQLINVLAGSMSLVGPRPEDLGLLERYSTEQRQLLSIRPGITSPASLSYRNEEALLPQDSWERTYLDTVLPRKLAIEREYFARRSLASDVGVILQTLWALTRTPGRRP